MEFRLDFFFRIVMDLFFYAINIGFYRVVFHHTSLIGGWNMDQMMLFISGFLLIDAINMTVFANNLWAITEYINSGELDYYLIRPVSSLFFLSVRDFAANSFINLLFAVGILVWAVAGYPGDLPWFLVFFFLAMIVMGTLLRYLVRLLFIMPAFWVLSGHGMETLFFSLNRFVERPDQIFTGVVRVILTTVLPFSLMASFPARLVIDEFNPLLLLHFFAVFAGFTAVVLWLWGKGLRAYSSASS